MASLTKAVAQSARGSAPNTLDRLTFGKRLRAARNQYGLTLAEVAQQGGLRAAPVHPRAALLTVVSLPSQLTRRSRARVTSTPRLLAAHLLTPRP